MIVEQGGIEGVAVRDTAVTARHSDVRAPACLFCVDPSGRRRRGVTVIHVRQDAWIWLRLDPQAGVNSSVWIPGDGSDGSCGLPARHEAPSLPGKPGRRPSEGSLACTDREVVQQLLLPSPHSRRAIGAPASFRGVRCVVRRRTVASLAPAAEAQQPRFDGRSKQGGVVGRGQLLVSRWLGARRSPCVCCAKAMARCVLSKRVVVVVFVILRGALSVERRWWCAALVVCVAGWRAPTTHPTACWPEPTSTTAYRKANEQDRCHHGRGH